jgi:myo-inositol-1(or 4)-monophosphatase
MHKSTGVLFDQIEQAGGKAFNFRSFAYSCCLVAAGTAVAATIGTPKPWDVAAAMVILEEAGGTLTGLAGKTQSYNSKAGLLATNGLVHKRMLELINE